MTNLANRPKAFVIGHPIKHSRSPMIHGHWLKNLNLDGSYQAVDVAPSDLAGFIEEIRAGKWIGGNVTIPHKEAVLPLCDRLDAAAETIGAVNTLVFENGELIGKNTDGIGFLANLDANAPGWDDKKGRALVLGAGGAARAILVGLAARGFSEIIILNRTEARANALAKELTKKLEKPFRAASLSSFNRLAASADLVVNTTAIGMDGTRFAGLSLKDLPETALVTDIVYTPLETPLLTEARQRGLRHVDGLGMLLHQAVPGFVAWFGKTPEVTTVLRQEIVATLTGQ